MKNKKCFIMGLPNAGKTTFLAALWYAVSNGENAVQLELSHIEGDTSYLAKLSEQWIECQPLDRTKSGEEIKKITIFLKDKKENYSLQFPDLSGETFQNWYYHRKIEKSLAKQVKEADSILFFINIKDIVAPVLINEANQYVDNERKENIGYKKAEHDSITVEESLESQIFSYKRNKLEHDPVCVQIIELLQFVSILRFSQSIKLGIVFSAWDLLYGNSMRPEDYAKQELALLWQFLETNKNCLEVSYWGLSAQGGKIEEKDKLLSYECPYERIQVVDDDMNMSHDITSVVYKLIGEIDG